MLLKLLPPFLLLFLFIVEPVWINAQEGCTDPLASNYDPAASINDGSCTYPATAYTPGLLGQLPGSLSECSGLTWADNGLWANNDNGNAPYLFLLDTLTGIPQRELVIAGASNVDWEDLAAGNGFFYIGDFGNNDGSRQDLRIYQMAENELQGDTVFTVDTIAFAFSDQSDFTPANLNTAYDCEAFFVLDDSLHLFTKDWINQRTKHYVLPAEPGNHLAILRDSFDTAGLVTAADISPDGVIVLLGYSGIESFAWLLFDYPSASIFGGHKRKISLGSITDLGQTEGIAFIREGEGFLSSETLFSFPAQLFRFTSGQWTDPLPTAIPGSLKFQPVIFPNPFNDAIQIRGIGAEKITLNLYDGMGKKVATIDNYFAQQGAWNLPALAPGFYWLSIHQNELHWNQKIIRLP